MKACLIGVLAITTVLSGCVPVGERIEPCETLARLAAIRLVIHGGDGSSYETALHIHGAHTAFLAESEKGYVYQKYWLARRGLAPPPLEEFERNTRHHSERRGKKVYDIVDTTLPDGETHTNYFNVTNYRYFWPNEK